MVGQRKPILYVFPWILLMSTAEHKEWVGVDKFISDKFSFHPDSKVHGANMGPTWALSAPDGPHVGPGTLLSGHGCHMRT